MDDERNDTWERYQERAGRAVLPVLGRGSPTQGLEKKCGPPADPHREGGGDLSFPAPETSNHVQQVQEVQPEPPGPGPAAQAGEAADPDRAIVEAAIAALASDPGAIYTDEAIAALRAVKDADLSGFMRLRARIKAANKDALLGVLDRAIQGDAENTEDPSLADQLVAFVQDRARLFHDQDRAGYAAFRVDGHLEVWPLDSTGFREWLGAEFYRETRLIPRETPLKDACVALAGIAKYDGEREEVSIRVAKAGNGYAIDLCDAEWRCAIVEPGAWRIASPPSPLPRFRRTPTMRDLPTPLAPGTGDVDLLWECVNIKKPLRDLLLAWMLECWRSDTAFTVLELLAEQGSGKSKGQHYIRELIDPNQVNLRAKPKAVEDIYVAAVNSWLASYENLSHLTDDMQDAFCVLATGGGFAARTLYTNAEETAIAVKRPIVMNGISVLATRQDLVDRLVHIEIEPIPTGRRRTETELDALFDRHRPAIFTGLLDLFAQALAILPGIHINELPRMADFARLGAAVYAARGVADAAESFMADYTEMRRESVQRTLDSSPVAAAIVAYLDKNPGGAEFTNAQNALKELSAHRHEGDAWPKSGKGFADALRRLAPALRMVGIRAEIAKRRGESGYPVAIRPVPVLPVLAVHGYKFSDAEKKGPPGSEVQESGPTAPGVCQCCNHWTGHRCTEGRQVSHPEAVTCAKWEAIPPETAL